EFNKAISYFDKSLRNTPDQSIKAQTLFWKGEIAHQKGNFDKSIDQLKQYFNVAGRTSLPLESSLFMANYIQGYNYIQLKNYGSASSYFKDALKGIKANKSKFGASTFKKLMGDALVRAGDCAFKKNDYTKANKHYDEAIQAAYPGKDYAQYQKAMIMGLTNKLYEKVILLESITVDHPTSKYADDAYYQLGITYKELGNSSEAIKSLNQLVEKFKKKSPLINPSYLRLGLYSFNQGDLNQALRYYKKVFDNNPNPKESQDAVSAIQEIYVDHLNQPESYVSFIKTVPGMDISEFKRDSINYRAAEIQYENAAYAEAITSFDEYIQNFPRGAYLISALYYKGESNALLKQYSKALEAYDKIIQKGQSEYFEKALNKAAIISYNHALDFKSSYNYFLRLETIASSEEESYKAILGAMRSAFRAELFSELPSLTNKVINHPRASSSDKATAYYFQGKSYFLQENYTEASRSFERVILSSDNEQTAEARYLRAKIAFNRNDLNNAERLALNANKASSGYPFWVAKNLILLSDILVKKKDYFNAKAPLEAVIDNFQDDPSIVEEAQQKLNEVKALEEESSRIVPEANENELNLLDTIPFEKNINRRQR
ncbi:MAG: tetratricopeptide repeat protein, partial [Bacteroidota bacterium]